jgi:hypothetical protein
MRQHVDEAGCDGETSRFNHLTRSRSGQVTHCHNAISADADVGTQGAPASAVIHGATLYQDIKRTRSRLIKRWRRADDRQHYCQRQHRDSLQAFHALVSFG